MPADTTPDPIESQDAVATEHAQDESGPTEQVEREKLAGIEGLLRTYYAYLLIGVGLSIYQLLPGIGSLFSGGNYLYLSVVAINFGLFTFAVISLKRFGEPWVRTFQVSLNCVVALIALIVVTTNSFALDWWSVLWVPSTLVSIPWTLVPVRGLRGTNFYVLLQVAMPLLWMAYWLMSGRIKNTYVDLRSDNNLFAKSGWLGIPFFKIGLAVSLIALLSLDTSLSSARGTQNPLIGIPSAYAVMWLSKAVMVGAIVILLSVGTWLGRQNNTAAMIDNNESLGQHRFMLVWGIVLGLVSIGMLATGVYLSVEQPDYGARSEVNLRPMGYGIVAVSLFLTYQVCRSIVIRSKLLRR
jgi:hypothetical protein